MKWLHVKKQSASAPDRVLNEKALFTEDGMERCVICKKKLDIPVATPVDQRNYYVCGCGQLCVDCFRLVRPTPDPEEETFERGKRKLNAL